jgi:hypothetical protein
VPEGTLSCDLGATEWTVIVIDGPKKIEEVLERFRVGEGVIITRIKI